MNTKSLAIMLSVGMLCPGYINSCVGADWPQFRGGIAQGVSASASFSGEPKILWQVTVPGAGWSQPIVFGKTIYLTTAFADPPILPKNFSRGVADPRSMPGSKATVPDVEMQWRVLALDRETGNAGWFAVAASGKPRYAIHPSNTYATETPCADADGVYAFFGATGTAAAFDHGGRPLWTRELGAHPTDENFGTGSSPALFDGKLFLQCFNKDQASIVCLQTRNGDELWRVDREKAGTSWCTPLVWQNSQRTEVIASGQKLMTSHDPATGAELWRIAGIDVPSTSSITGTAEAIYFGYRAPFSAGPLYALGAGLAGDLSPKAGQSNLEGQLWAKASAAPGMPTPVVAGECLYVLNNNVLSCHDPRSGELHYKQRLPEMATVAASPVAYKDCVVVVDEKGHVLFVKKGTTFEVVASLDLDDVIWSSPAIVGDRLLIRGVDHLYCVSQ
ncbi:MAG: PQQ-binding-like beta-propeller repeat protein [Singulisphaera sp.]